MKSNSVDEMLSFGASQILHSLLLFPSIAASWLRLLHNISSYSHPQSRFPPPRERTDQLPSCFLKPSFRPLLLHPLTPKTPPYAEDLLTSCLPPAPEPAPFMRGSTDRQYTASSSILIASYHTPPQSAEWVRRRFSTRCIANARCPGICRWTERQIA